MDEEEPAETREPDCAPPQNVVVILEPSRRTKQLEEVGADQLGTEGETPSEHVTQGASFGSREASDDPAV
jgi:hypothetical protein